MQSRITMPNRIRTYSILLMLACLPLQGAQEMDVPVELQYNLILKILEFDRTLFANENGEIVMGVIFQSKNRQSSQTKEKFFEMFYKENEIRIKGHIFRCIPVDLSDPVNLKETLKQKGIHVAYVAPLRAYNVNSISENAKLQKITTFTGVPEYMEYGLGIILYQRAQKPVIRINLASVKASGADFSSQLLNLAEVIR